MTGRRIGRHVAGGSEPADEREARERRDRLRDAFSSWASGVTLVAVRDGGRVHALTVSAFLPLSMDPPLVAVSLGPNASARPYLSPGAALGISVLRSSQRGLASRYADTFPVGPSPFGEADPPRVEGALATFACTVDRLVPGGDHELVIARVDAVSAPAGGGGNGGGGEGDAGEDAALAYFQRAYHAIG